MGMQEAKAISNSKHEVIIIGRFKDISSEEFKNVIENSYFMVDVLEKLGYSRTSGTMTKFIRERANKEGISLDHFLGAKGKRGGGNNQRYKLEEILIENSTYYNRDRLKIRLLSSGLLTEHCYICGMLPEWQGKKLSLHLDHINGVNNDNRIENLRLLCPNCHSQTITYSGRNRKKI